MKMELLRNIKSEGAEFILKNFMPIPQFAVTLLSASGGTGKTRLSLIMADRYIKETDGKYNVALWLTEDYKGQVKHIFDEMIQANLVSDASLDNMIIILEEPPQLAKRESGIFKANYSEIEKIGHALIEKNVKFAVFDPLLAFYGGNENDNSEARVFIQTFATWASKSNITTLIIHHASKEGGSRGATAFHDGVRARYELDLPYDKDGNVDKNMMANGFRVATLKKDNWGVRKYLWKITDGLDSITLRVAPPLINDKLPIVTEYINNDNDFMKDF